MKVSLCILVMSVCYNLLLIAVYFSKKRLKKIENKIFIGLMISNLLGLFLEMGCIFTVSNMNKVPLLNVIVTRFYLVYLLVWITLMTMYVFIISRTKTNDKNYIQKRFKMFFSILITIILFLILFLPMNYYYDNIGVYSYGLSVNVMYVVSAICILSWIICITKNYKSIKEKKYLPIYVYIMIGSIVMLIQAAHPTLLLLTSMETFITVLMYFTIENPDLQLLREFHNIKEYADKTNNEKSMFLFNMSQQIKAPILKIDRLNENIIEEDDVKNCKNNALEIKAVTRSLMATINEVLDVSRMESRELKVFNNKYNTSIFFEEISKSIKNNILNKNVGFIVNFDESMPNYLYGDSLALKRILMIILNNSVKYTDKGFIEFNVNSVIKYDVCRLIITIEDSGCGMSNSKLEDLFSKNTKVDKEDKKDNLAVAKSLANLIGGTIMVSSEQNKGSKFTVIIDQKIVAIETNDTLKKVESFEKEFINEKKVLVVTDNDKLMTSFTKMLKKYPIDIIEAKSGEECLNRIRNKEKYDIIFISDVMEKLNGVNTYRKLNEIDKFNINTVMIVDNDTLLSSKEYLKEGFDDFITLPIDKNEVDRVIKKFLG